MRGRLSCQRHGALGRGTQRDGLQPLHRHPLLLEQLPVQGPSLQLPEVHRLRHAEPADDAQPRRHDPQPRCDGEMHLLRAAHQPCTYRGEEGKPQGA